MKSIDVSTTQRVVHLRVRKLALHSFERRHVLRRKAIVIAEQSFGIIRGRPDHRNLADGRFERQRLFVVLQKHDRFPGGFECHFAMLGGIVHRVRNIRERHALRRIEHAKLETRDEQALQRAVGLVAQTPYLNPDLPTEQRAKDLVSRMTLDEKVLQMQNSARIAEDVDVRRPERQPTIAAVIVIANGLVVLGASFRRYHVGDPVHQVGVPHRCEANGLRKHRGLSGAGDAMQRFVPPVVCGNAKAGNRRSTDAIRNTRCFMYAPESLRKSFDIGWRAGFSRRGT
jgi:hypothetical protein